MARRSAVNRTVDSYDRWVDATVATLVARIDSISRRAVARVIRELAAELDRARGGIIEPTGSNQQTLRRLDAIFQQALRDLGYFDVVAAWTATSFPKAAPYFERTFEALNATLKEPLPEPRLGAEQVRFLSSRAVSAGVSIQNEARILGRQATRRALFSAGATPMPQLVEQLSSEYGKLPTRVASLADTLITTHYRTIQSLSYEAVEEEVGRELAYRYFGPRDKLNRPFCKRVLASNTPRTKAQIQALSNPSGLGDTFRTCGGWSCRHQWAAVGFAEGAT